MFRSPFIHKTPVFILLFLAGTHPLFSIDFDALYDSAKKMRSITLGEKALELAKTNADEQQLAKAHFLIAYYQKAEGMYYEALNHYFSALYAFKATRNYGRQIGMLMNIGVIYVKGGFHDKAIEFYQDAAALAKEMNDIARLRSIQYNIGKTHRLVGDYDQAREIYLALLDQKEDIKNKKLLSDTYLEIAMIYGTHENDYKTAKPTWTRPVRCSKNQDQKPFCLN